MNDGLQNLDAEEAVLAFLLSIESQDVKMSVLQVLTTEHFSYLPYKEIYDGIKEHLIFDPIILWDKIGKDKKRFPNVELPDIGTLKSIVTSVTVQSYTEILIDKYQKRKIYEFGQQLQDAMLEGADQYDVALKAQSILNSMDTKAKLETNQELLEKVLNEKPGDVLSSGFKTIDKFIGGYARGMIITIAGDSGHLKTTLALDKAFRMAETNPKIKIGIFSKEMLATDLVKKQISRICGIPTAKIFSQEYDKEYVREEMMKVEAWRNNRIRIVNPNSFSGVADIAKIQMTHRFDVWFLDFIQLLEFAKMATNASDYNIQIGQNMRNLQALALATGSVGIILSQVKKGVERRRIMRPTVSDIEWSGLIKQLSSYIFFSYYPGKYYGFDVFPDNYYFLIAEKTRFAESFTYPMEVNPSLGMFTEIDDINERQKRVNKLREIVY